MRRVVVKYNFTKLLKESGRNTCKNVLYYYIAVQYIIDVLYICWLQGLRQGWRDAGGSCKPKWKKQCFIRNYNNVKAVIKWNTPGNEVVEPNSMYKCSGDSVILVD